MVRKLHLRESTKLEKWKVEYNSLLSDIESIKNRINKIDFSNNPILDNDVSTLDIQCILDLKKDYNTLINGWNYLLSVLNSYEIDSDLLNSLFKLADSTKKDIEKINSTLQMWFHI